LETSGGVLSTVDTVVQRRDGPRWLRELDDDDDMSPGQRGSCAFDWHVYHNFMRTYPALIGVAAGGAVFRRDMKRIYIAYRGARVSMPSVSRWRRYTLFSCSTYRQSCAIACY